MANPDKPKKEHMIPTRRGRPPKAAGTGMIPKNISISIQDELALRRLAGALQMHYITHFGVNCESMGASWATRALIRYAEQQTRGHVLGMDNKFLDELVVLGDVNAPQDEAAD
jgi:hypothetical protein